MGAADFTTVEIWTRSGLMTYYILVVMKLSTRRIEIAGVTLNPDTSWIQQMGRNLTDCYDGFLNDTRCLLLDRDTKSLPFCGVRSPSSQIIVISNAIIRGSETA